MSDLITPIMPYTPALPISAVRAALGRIGKLAAPLARPVDRWILQPELAKSVADLTVKADNDERGKLHAVVIGAVGLTPLTQTTGNTLVEWLVDLRIAIFRWYEFGTSAENSSNAVVEREARLFSLLVMLNRSSLGLDNPAASSFRGVTTLPTFPRDQIDIVNFAEGVSAHMALGNMQVKLQEQITETATAP